MPNRQMQGDGFYDAIARFQHAPSSSYLVLAWQTDTTPPLTPSPTRSKTLWEPTLKRSKSTNTLRIPAPQEIKTRHTFTAEGRLIGFNLDAVKRYLSPGSCYHVLLRDRDAVVLIQQMAGASVGNKRKRALAAGRSLLAFAPYVTTTISITHLDELEDELLDFDMGRASPMGPSLVKSNSIITLPGKVSRVVPRYELADEPLSKASPTSPSAWTSEKAGMMKSRRISTASSMQSSDTVFLDCEGSVDTLHDDEQKRKAEERRPQPSPPVAVSSSSQKSKASPTRELPPIPIVPVALSASLRKSASAWVVSSDPAKGSDDSRYESIVSEVTWTKDPRDEAREEQKRRQALDEAKREQVMKRLTAEQNTWESGVPSYYENENDDKTNDTVPANNRSAQSTSTMRQQRGAKRSPPSKPLPLFPPPALPLPGSPKTLSSMASSPIVFSFSTQAKVSSPFPQDEDEEDQDQSHPVITLGGYVRRRSRSQTVSSRISRQSTRQADEAAHLSSMPPFLASLELARNKIQEMQQSGLEGESWIHKRQRERSESDANEMSIKKGWAMTDPLVAAAQKEIRGPAPIVQSSRSEALQARRRSLCLQLAVVQKTATDIDKAERLRNIQWAGEASYRQQMDAFERSQRESAERQTRQRVEEEKSVIQRKMYEIQREQMEVKGLIEEASTYRGKVEQAKRERASRMQFDDREKHHKQQQEQIKLRVKAERRADLRVELQTSAAPVLAMGFMTVQSDDGLRKRRGYELHRDELLLFAETGFARRPSLVQSHLDEDEPLARVVVEPGSIIMIRDDSEASQTAHSFFVKYHDDVKATQEVLKAFTDTEAEKERLLIGLSMLSCYKLTDDTFES